MNNLYKTILCLLLWSQYVFSIPGSQLNFDISAQSIPRVELYYEGLPVSENPLNFPLIRSPVTGKLENRLSPFYLVGNVTRAEIYFDADVFLLEKEGGDSSVNVTLNGSFTFLGNETDARSRLMVPVIKKITEQSGNPGLGINFASEKRQGDYEYGNYSNSFILVITPVI